MLGFRLEKKSRIDSDVLFYILIIVYTVVFFLLLSVNMPVEFGDNLLDKIAKFAVCLLFGLLLSVLTSSVSLYSTIQLVGFLFRGYCIRYYTSDTSVDIADDNLLSMIYDGKLPFIDDEYVDKLGYTVKCVKIDKKEYENICSMIADKKRVMEMEELARLMKQYEKDGVPKIYLGV
jgi:hypothetical protein